MVEVNLDYKDLEVIMKASFGGRLTDRDKQRLGFIVLKARHLEEVV